MAWKSPFFFTSSVLIRQISKVFFDMNLEAAEKLANEINQYGHALAIQCDITQSDVVEQAVQKT